MANAEVSIFSTFNRMRIMFFLCGTRLQDVVLCIIRFSNSHNSFASAFFSSRYKYNEGRCINNCANDPLISFSIEFHLMNCMLLYTVYTRLHIFKTSPTQKPSSVHFRWKKKKKKWILLSCFVPCIYATHCVGFFNGCHSHFQSSLDVKFVFIFYTFHSFRSCFVLDNCISFRIK